MSNPEWIYAKVGSTEMRGRKGPSGIDFEQVSDTYDKNELQKAVEEIEKKIGGTGKKMEGEHSSKCSASLIELRNALKREIPDEGAAAHMYADMAAKFTHLKEPIQADLLRLISGQEALHQAILEFITEEITLRCEE